MNYLWGFMIVSGITYAAFHGTLPDVTAAALDSAKEAIALCITMTGVMSFWVGLMHIAKNAGIIQNAVQFLKPLLHFLFPKIPKDHPAYNFIAENFIANIFGLGWAAAPAGLKAMKALSKLDKERGNTGTVANNEMCTFLILNISSLQLIPVNMIAYRSQYGSVNPAAIVGPAMLATFASTITAILYCLIKNHQK